jgi:hypothetical protein
MSNKKIGLGIFIVLLLTALILLVSFVFDLRSLYKTGELRPSRGLHRNYVYRIQDPTQIEGWMTFSYVDYIFKLPKDYLLKSFAITDSHYPNLEINQYANEKKFDTANFLKQIRESVAQYIKNGN